MARKDFHVDALILTLSFTVMVSILFLVQKADSQQQSDTEEPRQVLTHKCSKCPSVLEFGVKGEWVRGKSKEISRLAPLTDADLRKAFYLPEKWHREDLRCGWSHPFANFTLPSGCNANSSFYCCSEQTGWCGNTLHHCNHPKSTNYRNLVPSSDAVWKPAKSDCSLADISRREACGILSKNQINLIFIGFGQVNMFADDWLISQTLGDSEARKFSLATLLFLTGDFSQGVLTPDATFDAKKNCFGELQLLNEDCKQLTIDSSILLHDTEGCGFKSEFLVEYFSDYNTFFTARTRERITSLNNITNTYLIMNSGAHFNANLKSFVQYYLAYIVKLFDDDKNWPKLIVETMPRTPSILLNDIRATFGNGVREFCQRNGLMMLDNFDLTRNLKPYDGKHFGLPFYFLKVKILLNLLKQQMEVC